MKINQPLFLVFVLAACLLWLVLQKPLPVPETVLAQTTDPVLVGAGDIAHCSQTEDEATAQLLDGIAGTVFTLGDNVYADGTLAEFNDCYEPTWGRHKNRTRPAPGNHDYHITGAAGYYTYFGATASPLDSNCTSDCRGYYSYNLGAWHIIVLNSEIPHGAGSPQEQWLRADLAANQSECTLAYWHRPRFSSGKHGNSVGVQPFWQALYDDNADVVLSGHDHSYERFAPQDPTGQADPTRGIREFVVGTGGAGLYAFVTVEPNSEVRNNTAWGVLKLTLHPTSYDWEFVPVAGQTFTDAGSANCVSSASLPTPTATLPESGSLSLLPEADALVRETSPDTNYGTSTRLDVDSPSEQSFIRFTVSGVTETVQSARLRLFVANGSSNGAALYSTSNEWTETGITWNNRPAPTTGALDDLGAITANTWVEYDLTGMITGDGIYSFVLLPDSANGITFSSRETGSPPALVLTFAAKPTPTETPLPPTDTPGEPTATPTPTSTPAPGDPPAFTPTATDTPTGTLPPGDPPAFTPTVTDTPTPAGTLTPGDSPGVTPTATDTPTGTLTPGAPSTFTPTATDTPTPAGTLTGTPSPAPTATAPDTSGASLPFRIFLGIIQRGTD